MDDGRPYSTDEFLVRLIKAREEWDMVDYEFFERITDWLHGDWKSATKGLDE